jgi:hypothetical protein
MLNASSSMNTTSALLAKDKTCRRIEQMEADREERRRAMLEVSFNRLLSFARDNCHLKTQLIYLLFAILFLLYEIAEES